MISVSGRTPVCVLFIVDVDATTSTFAERALHSINLQLFEMFLICHRGASPRNLFYVAALAYGEDQRLTPPSQELRFLSLLLDRRSVSGPIHPISELVPLGTERGPEPTFVSFAEPAPNGVQAIAIGQALDQWAESFAMSVPPLVLRFTRNPGRGRLQNWLDQLALRKSALGPVATFDVAWRAGDDSGWLLRPTNDTTVHNPCWTVFGASWFIPGCIVSTWPSSVLG